MPEPAEQLRAAAQRLRELARAAVDDMEFDAYWQVSPSETKVPAWMNGIQHLVQGAPGKFAAAMHPGVALALAALLDQHAHEYAVMARHNRTTTDGQSWPESANDAMEAALLLARLVLEAK